MSGHLAFDSLPDPTGKFELGEIIASGYTANVYKAKDVEKGTYVAMKIQPYDQEHQVHIEEEYRVLRDYSSYPNIPDFYGVFRKKKSGSADEVWFAMELCEGGTAVDLSKKMLAKDRKMKEEHIAYIIREAAKAVLELNRNHFIHRDVRGSNILLTRNGEVKLCDFGLTREVDSTFGKRGTCIGSPCWMSPEVVTAQDARSHEVYDSRSDVWALGITTIELGEGKAPFYDMHPTRAMFQIVRNPPPTMTKISNWTQNLNDFVAECLEKNPENRPHLMEMIEHPFLTELPESEYSMQEELKQLVEMYGYQKVENKEEVAIDQGYIKRLNQEPEKMVVEDFAAMENASEEQVVEFISERMKRGQSYAFIGDILLSVNSNEQPESFPADVHARYKFKSRSENAPHIFTAADVAYQDMMHHKEPQYILFAGESYSGKSRNVRLFIEHLFFLGAGNKGATERVDKGMRAINMLVNAGTPLNNNSTRCIMQQIVTFGTTGKLSGAVFVMNLLEKMRVSTTDMNQHNFHIFYYLYDFIEANGLLSDMQLDSGRNYRYLRIPAEKPITKIPYVRDNPETNVAKYKEFEDILIDLDISRKNLDTIRRVLAAILNLGNVRFQSDEKKAVFEDPDVPNRVAELMRLDEKKFVWSMLNYCKVKGGIAERKHYTAEEARDSRDSLAATIYNRLVDWIINKINMNLAFPRAVFGDTNAIHVYDMYGFECFERNSIEQLMINTLSEQMQYHYNQLIFANAAYEQEMDGVPPVSINYYDNKQVLDHLLTKPEGLFSIIDDATKTAMDYDAISEKVQDKRSQFIKKADSQHISVSHYTGKITYDVRGFIDANRDFVPPEMIEALRSSLEETIVLMFTNNLSKAGNLTMEMSEEEGKKDDSESKKRNYTLNTLSQGVYSQINQMRTLATLFRSICLQLLKVLTCRNDNAGCHFIRCIRGDLNYQPRGIHRDMVLQQVKALAIVDTILARQQGYSCRITFQEFLNRYQFLAFDFDETVDVTKDNCRLMLIRMKMEGWAIGKSKVFLRYYNDEYLARLYETQVKKIIKVQAMMRSYLLRKRKNNPNSGGAGKLKTTRGVPSRDEAAVRIQKAFRGHRVRQQYGPLINQKTGQIDHHTAGFLKMYVKRWRMKSLFQVLLHYRAARFQDLVNLSQQVHLYNQRFATALQITGKSVNLDRIDHRQTNPSVFGPLPLPTRKLPFRLDEIPYFDTNYMCDTVNPLANYGAVIDEEKEAWDAPLQPAPSLTQYLMTYNAYKKEQACQTSWDRREEADLVHQQHYSRDPNQMKRSSAPNREFDRSGNTKSSYMQTSSSNYRSSAANRYTPSNERRSSQEFSSNRRASIKNRAAPTPPPMQGMRNDSSWMKNNDSRPANPVRELQMMGRRSSMDNNTGDEEPPFNFKAMLRKTNYRPEERNNGYTSYQTNSGGPSYARKQSVKKKSASYGNISDSGSVSGANYADNEYSPEITEQGDSFVI